MKIADIYEKFDQIGCLTFATINKQGEPETRIAHLRAYDDDGLYFMTMFTKEFYCQLKESGKVALCGLSAKTQVEHDENGFPIFECGYTMRLTGTVREVSIAEIRAKNNPIFDFCLKDQEKYKAMVIFCVTGGYGEIYDYDFDKITRNNKLERTYFAFGDARKNYKGLLIDQNKCTACGICVKKCSFLAVKEQMKKYSILENRCDECGDCYLNCPAKAISYRGEDTF